MRKKTRELKKGDVVASGEVVVSTTTLNMRQTLVVLDHPQKNRRRTAVWGRNSTIFLKSTMGVSD